MTGKESNKNEPVSGYPDEESKIIKVEEEKVFEGKSGNRHHTVRIVVGDSAFYVEVYENVRTGELETDITTHRHTGSVTIFTGLDDKVTKKTTKFNDSNFKSVELEVVQ